jgi:cytochrome c oxidase subunit 2
MHIDSRERMFIIGSVVLLIVFASAIAVSAFATGIQVPTPYQRVDPRIVATPGSYPGLGFSDPLDERLRELSPGKYEVYILAQTWAFTPNEVRVPAGSTVTFYLTSKDVQHGFRLDNTNISMMVLPGEVSKLTATFDTPGTYNFVCHEYCGVAHHTMYGKLVVEP